MGIYSITKTKLDENSIKKIVEKSLGHEGKLVGYSELGEGYFNTAYLLALEDREVVLKVSPPTDIKVLRYEKNIMEAEVGVLQLLKTHEIPVPEVLYYDPSKQVIENAYYVMEKLEGEPYNHAQKKLSEEQKANIDYKIGTYVRQINGIQNERFGYYAQPEEQTGSWIEAFDRMIKDILLDAEEYEVRLPIEKQKLYELISKEYAYLQDVGEASLVHWDLWAGNVFVDCRGEITGIIDCERAFWGDSLMEFHFSTMGVNEAVYNGYGASLIRSEEELHKQRLYDIYRLLVMYVECFYRQYADDGQKNWAYEELKKKLHTL